MIERQIVKEKLKEFQIQEYIYSRMSGADFSHALIKKTPLGDKIIIYAAKPGMVVGRKGENIRMLTEELNKKFKLENPQVEIAEIDNLFLDADVVAERMVSSLERFGSMRFKQIGHKMLESVMRAGALGIEIKMSGKIPSARAKSWRFYKGYLKKSGDAAEMGVRKSIKSAKLKAGVIGVIVRIMPPDIELPDAVEKISKVSAEEKKEEKKEEAQEKKEEEKKKPRKKAVRKKTAKTKAKKETAEKEVVESAESIKVEEPVKEAGGAAK